jgi:hypothetical protein
MLDYFFEIASVKCLRRPGAVGLHTNLISRLACSDNSTNVLGLPGHVFQTARTQSTSRTGLEIFFAGSSRSIIHFMLPFIDALHPSMSVVVLLVISKSSKRNCARYCTRPRSNGAAVISAMDNPLTSAVLPVMTPT